jgi:sugar phosphate isomerase/epimerase
MLMTATKPKYSILDHRVAGWYLPWMMKGLTPTTSPLEQKIRLMKSLGYDGVGTSWWDLVSFYQERGDLAQLRRLSAELKAPLTAYGFVADGWAFGSGKAQQNAILLAKSSLDLAHAAGCDGPYLVGPFDSGNLREAAKVFRELAQYAASLGMNLALEFIGVAAQVKDLDTSRELLDHAGVPDTGIALDSYHFFAGGSTFRALDEFPISQILVVHLADAPADLSDPSLELDRQMPGEGELQLTEFVQMVHAKGFGGYWHVECIQGRDYASDLKSVAQRALTTTRAVVEGAIHQLR